MTVIMVQQIGREIKLKCQNYNIAFKIITITKFVVL